MGHSDPQMVNEQCLVDSMSPQHFPRRTPTPTEGGFGSESVQSPGPEAGCLQGGDPAGPMGAVTLSLYPHPPPELGPCAVRPPAADPWKRARGTAWLPLPAEPESPRTRAAGSTPRSPASQASAVRKLGAQDISPRALAPRNRRTAAPGAPMCNAR